MKYATTYAPLQGVDLTRASPTLRPASADELEPVPPASDEWTSARDWELIGTAVNAEYIYWTWRRPE